MEPSLGYEGKAGVGGICMTELWLSKAEVDADAEGSIEDRGLLKIVDGNRSLRGVGLPTN